MQHLQENEVIETVQSFWYKTMKIFSTDVSQINPLSNPDEAAAKITT